MSMNLIAIGVDQSKQATGLCMYQFDLKGRYKFMRSATVETPTYQAMEAALTNFVGLNTPTVIMAEGAFYSAKFGADKFAAAIRTAAFVEAVCIRFKLGEYFDVVEPAAWRRRSLGTIPRGTTRDMLKALSIKAAKKHGLTDPDDNQADASGIARYAITAYLKHLEERIDDD